MKKLFLTILTALALVGTSVPAFAQATHVITSGTLPTNCTTGDVYIKTGANAGFYRCSATDTWTKTTDALDTIAALAATTSSQLKGVISDENAPDGASSKLLMALGSISIASGKTLTVSNSFTVTATDASTVAFGAGGTVAYTTVVNDTAYDATSWDSDTTHAPSKNAVRDLIESFCSITDPGANTLIGWDDTDNACVAITVGTGLSYDHASHTISNSTSTLPVTDTTGISKGSSDATKIVRFEVDGLTTATTRVVTVPDFDLTLVGLTNAQTLTNKTLTAPIISTISNTGTVTLFTSTDTVVGKATTDVLTNKTLDCDAGTGNVCTIKSMFVFTPAVNQAGTASLAFNTPASTGATATAVGSTVVAGHVTFPNSGAKEVQFSFPLPADWDSSLTTQVIGKYRSAGTTGNFFPQVFGVCAADGEVVPTSFNATPDTSADATKGATLQENDFTITLSTASGHPLNGCAAGEQFYVQFYRDPADGSDTLSSDVEIISLQFIYRRVM